MKITATQKNTRQTTRKVLLVANTVKKLPLERALQQLAVMERRASLVVMKVMKQALANAINNHGLKFEDLLLDNILVTEGPRYRRFQAVSRGRAHGIIKRTSHVTVTLVTKDEVAKAQPAVQPAKASLSLPAVAETEAKTAAKTDKPAQKSKAKTTRTQKPKTAAKAAEKEKAQK